MSNPLRFYSDQKWLIESPELLELDQTISAQALIEMLEATHGFDFTNTHRIGVYFEQLCHHLIQANPDFELCYKNQQLIVDKHTYGEFDSIIFDKKQQETIHLELAVKFYLQIGNGDKLSDWVGPNLKDRFDHKIERLFEHQLKLSKLPQAIDWLIANQMSIEQIRLVTRGRLFYPFKSFMGKRFLYPPEVNKCHAKGFWIEQSELVEFLQANQFDWYQLPRFYWLAEIEKIDEQLMPVEQGFSGFSLQKIVALKNGKEVMRGFVVNDDWLHKARQRILD